MEGLDIIKDVKPDDPKCDQLMDYFEKQWIEKIKPEIWNHHESDIRTNNKIEGFHSALNKLVKTNHPNIFHLINFLKQHQSSVLVEYERLKQSQVITKKSKKDQDKELRLELIKREHKTSSNLKDFLLSLCQYVQYPYEYWFDEENLENFDESSEEFIENEDDDLYAEDVNLRLVDNAAQQNSNLSQDDNLIQEQTEISTADPICIQNQLSTYASLETVNIQQTNFNPQHVDEQEYDTSPKTSSSSNRIPLASLIASDPNFYNNLNDSSFDYIESITDRSPLRKMREAKRQEEIQIQNRIQNRKNQLYYQR